MDEILISILEEEVVEEYNPPLDFVNPKRIYVARENVRDLASSGIQDTEAFDIIYDNTKELMRKRLEEEKHLGLEGGYLDTPEKLEAYLDKVSKNTVEDAMKLFHEFKNPEKGKTR